MTPKDYLKLLFRLIHIRYFLHSSGIYVSGNLVSDYLFGPRSGQLHLYCACYVLLLISGVVNSILLAPSKLFPQGDAQFWKRCIWVKIGLLAALSPLLNRVILMTGGTEDCVRCTQALLVAVTVLVSSVAKQYRDRNSVKPPKKD